MHADSYTALFKDDIIEYVNIFNVFWLSVLIFFFVFFWGGGGGGGGCHSICWAFRVQYDCIKECTTGPCLPTAYDITPRISGYPPSQNITKIWLTIYIFVSLLSCNVKVIWYLQCSLIHKQLMNNLYDGIVLTAWHAGKYKSSQK